MKSSLFFLIFFFALSKNALTQKIKLSEYDKFSKTYKIETSAIALKGGLSNGLYLSFRSVDSTILITTAGYGKGLGVIGKDDKFVFLLKDDNTVIAKSKGIQSYRISTSTNTYTHEYIISLNDLEILQKIKTVGIRKYLSDGYTDFQISENVGEKLIELITVFLNEFNKK